MPLPGGWRDIATAEQVIGRVRDKGAAIICSNQLPGNIRTQLYPSEDPEGTASRLRPRRQREDKSWLSARRRGGSDHNPHLRTAALLAIARDQFQFVLARRTKRRTRRRAFGARKDHGSRAARLL